MRRKETSPQFAFNRHQRRYLRKEEARINKSVGIGLGWFMSLFGHLFVAFFITLFIFIAISIPIIIVSLSFIIKSIIRLCRKNNKKEKVSIFSLSEFEKGLIGFIKNQLMKLKITLSKIGHSAISDTDRADRMKSRVDNQNTPWGSIRDSQSPDNGRYCEVCGSRLGGGRKKYCSHCRLAYRREPFDY